MQHICVFDVNETLLDLRALDSHFEQVFGDASVRQVWFTQLLQTTFVSTLLGEYRDFGSIGATALEMIAMRRSVTLTPQACTRLLQGMRQLPPHADVRDGLERLRSGGLRLVALTNSTEQVAHEQLSYAGLHDAFEYIFSADTVRRLKPAPEPYQMVAHHLGVEIGQLRLIAAHSWDIAGALHAGCAGAFLSRSGMVLDPLFVPPDIIGTDLREVAERILAKERG